MSASYRVVEENLGPCECCMKGSGSGSEESGLSGSGSEQSGSGSEGSGPSGDSGSGDSGSGLTPTGCCDGYDYPANLTCRITFTGPTTFTVEFSIPTIPGPPWVGNVSDLPCEGDTVGANLACLNQVVFDPVTGTFIVVRHWGSTVGGTICGVSWNTGEVVALNLIDCDPFNVEFVQSGTDPVLVIPEENETCCVPTGSYSVSWEFYET